MHWYIGNANMRMDVASIVKWAEYDCTILRCLKKSDRGASVEVYMVGARSDYGAVGSWHRYTGVGKSHYTGSGEIKVLEVYNVLREQAFGKTVKLPVWVFK